MTKLYGSDYQCVGSRCVILPVNKHCAHLNDSDDVSEAALQEVSVDEHAESEAGTAVAVYQLSYEPRA